MYVKKTVDTVPSGYPPIMKGVRKTVAESGVREGYCVVSLEEASTRLGTASFWDKRGPNNLMDEIGRNLPARMDCHSQTPSFDVSGGVRGTVVDRSATLLIYKGELVFGSPQGLVLLEFGRPWRRTYYIQMVEAGLELDSYQVETYYMGIHDITDKVRWGIAKSWVCSDVRHITQFHFTAGLLLCSKEEGAKRDIMGDIEQLVPTRTDFKHQETAADAGGHVETAIADGQLPPAIEDGGLALGEGQAMALVEYGGPRPRAFYVGVIHG